MLSKKPKYNKLIDRELIELHKSSNDLNAMGELFSRYTHLVASIALGILNNEQKAKDTVQEIFEIIIQTLGDSNVKNFNAFVYSTTKLHCFKIKNEAHKIDFEIDSDEILEKELLLQNRIVILKKSIENLNHNQKKCIELFYFEGFCYSEIVNQTGLSIKEVKSHIQNGKKNIKSLLENSEDW